MADDITVYVNAGEIVAKMPGVRQSLATHATAMGNTAKIALAKHHNNTAVRYHDSPAPEIVVTRGKLDWYVFLEAGSLERAVGIEFGHRFQDRRKNRSGPWGQSSGIHVLRRASQMAFWG